MMQEVSDLQKKRAYNLIWNAAADYTFAPDFKFYTEEGNADIYWNSILGLARKHYDYEQLKNLFRSLETEEEAGEYESLLWLGLENALVAKEQETRPALPELQKQYAQRYLDRYGGDLTEDDRFFDFLAKAHYRRVLGLEEQLSRYDRNLLDELGLDEDEIVNSKMDKNEAKYPVELAKGSAEKYTELKQKGK